MPHEFVGFLTFQAEGNGRCGVQQCLPPGHCQRRVAKATPGMVAPRATAAACVEEWNQGVVEAQQFAHLRRWQADVVDVCRCDVRCPIQFGVRRRAFPRALTTCNPLPLLLAQPIKMLLWFAHRARLQRGTQICSTFRKRPGARNVEPVTLDLACALGVANPLGANLAEQRH